MATKRLRPADVLRQYLRELGAKGGKAAAGRGGQVRWANVSEEARSRMMRDLVKKRWAKARKKRSSS